MAGGPACFARWQKSTLVKAKKRWCLWFSMGFFFLFNLMSLDQGSPGSKSVPCFNVEEAYSVEKQSTSTGYILWMCSVWNTQGYGGIVITAFDCTVGTKKHSWLIHLHLQLLHVTRITETLKDSEVVLYTDYSLNSVASLLGRRTTGRKTDGGLNDVTPSVKYIYDVIL